MRGAVLIAPPFAFPLALLAMSLGAAPAEASPLNSLFQGDTPSGPLLEFEDGMTLPFCAKWDPEFSHRGGACCRDIPRGRGRRGRPGGKCAPQRYRSNRCDEMTPAQRRYRDDVAQGRIKDVMSHLQLASEASSKQAYCDVNDGFLANGREVVETPSNRLLVRSASRCLNFGTERMAALLDWLGGRVAQEYSDPKFSGVRLLIGDLTGPRGGCVTGQSGRRGHSSHTNGLDADIGFFSPRAGAAVPVMFNSYFDPSSNWWLIKQIFQNPHACVRILFTDRRHINRLAKAAAGDPLWPVLRRYIRHIRGHRGHMHLRIGEWPGAPGCQGDPDSEVPDETGEEEINDISNYDGSAVAPVGSPSPAPGQTLPEAEDGPTGSTKADP